MKDIKVRSYTVTPKMMKDNCKKALQKEKERLIEIMKKKQQIIIAENECFNQIQYWESMLK